MATREEGGEGGLGYTPCVDGVHKLSRELKNLLLPDELGMQQHVGIMESQVDTMLGRLDELVAVLHRTQEDSLAKKQALEPALKSLSERLQADYAYVDKLCASLVSLKGSVQRMEADISAAEQSVLNLQRQQRAAAGEPVGLGGSIVTALFGGRPQSSANAPPPS